MDKASRLLKIDEKDPGIVVVRFRESEQVLTLDQLVRASEAEDQ